MKFQQNMEQMKGWSESGWSDNLRPDQEDVKALKNDAKQGSTGDQLRLATLYFKGYNVQQDPTEAIKWLEKAAEYGNFEARIRLANCYLYGKGVDQNYTHAVNWLKKAVAHDLSCHTRHDVNLPFEKQELPKAQYNLGLCYLQGYGVDKNPAIAVEWLKKAAEQGYAPAQIRLAEFYFQSVDVEKDEAEAIKWLEKAAGLLEHPYPNIHRQGMIYFCKDGNRLAQRKLGLYYLGKENYSEAIKYFEEVANSRKFSLFDEDKEFGRAQAELGICYYYAKNDGLPFEEAFEEASKQNDSLGCLWLAYLNNLKNKPVAEKITGINGLDMEILLASSEYSPEELERRKQIINVRKNEKKIAKYLYMAGAGLFLQENDNYSGIDIINYAFPDEIIRFLENERVSAAKVILAFYYRDKEKEYLEYLKQASFARDMLANFLLGKHYKNKDSFDKAIHYFKKVNEDRISTECEYLLITQDFLSYSAKEELSDIKHQEELDEKNKRLEDANHRMQRLVEQFTHSLGNVIFPDTIYQVAERLKNNPECRKDVLLLHEAYHSEIIIKLQGELLRQRYTNTNTNPEKFRQFIRSCRRTPNSVEKTKSIEDILDYAASRVTARFLNQHYAGLNSIRDNMLSKKNLSLDALKQKFEDDILLNKSLHPIAWINQHLRPVQVTELSPLWRKVFILSESHAEALLFGYFSEILFNAFKYADHDKDEFLTLVFGEKTINDKTYLMCSWLNPVKNKSPEMLGTGKGLDAIQEDLKQLNDTAYPEESLLISQQNNQFQVTLFFTKDLLVNDLPSLKIKRKANVE